MSRKLLYQLLSENKHHHSSTTVDAWNSVNQCTPHGIDSHYFGRLYARLGRIFRRPLSLYTFVLHRMHEFALRLSRHKFRKQKEVPERWSSCATLFYLIVQFHLPAPPCTRKSCLHDKFPPPSFPNDVKIFTRWEYRYTALVRSQEIVFFRSSKGPLRAVYGGVLLYGHQSQDFILLHMPFITLLKFT